MDTEVLHLVRIIDQAYDRKSWHGTNLRGSIRGLTAAHAAARPAPERHNIHEIVIHAAYWKYAVWRRLAGERRGSFPIKGSNWFPRVGASEAAWRDDVALLERMHRRLRAAIASMSARDVAGTAAGSQVSNFDLIAGIAAHDLYHAGQIQLIKKLRPARRP